MPKSSENWLTKSAGISAVATVFFLPLSITALCILYPLTILFSVLNYRNWNMAKNWWLHPVVLVTGLYFLLYVLGLTYSDGTWDERIKDFDKHLWLFGTILLIPIFTEKKWRDFAINAFLCAMIFTAILSYCKFYGLFSWHQDFGTSAIFNNYIVQSILLVFAAVLILERYLTEPKKNWHLLILALFLIFNIFFISEGRTGYVIFSLLFCYLIFQRFHLKGLILAFFALCSFCVLAYYFSNTLHQRINQVVAETEKNHYLNHGTSMGRRYAEALNSWYSVKQSPWIGYGTGGIRAAYSSLPHELFQRAILKDQLDLDYFNILMKFGFIGLAVVLAFFSVIWFYANALEPRERFIAQGLVLCFLASCIVDDLMNTIVSSHLLSIFIALAFAALLSNQKSIKV